MSQEMDWSHDFCLSCDRQTNEGAYCSQACRLADMEKAGSTEPASPSTITPSFDSSPLAAWNASNSSGFHLSPAINFATYKAPSQAQSPPASPRTITVSRPSYFYYPTTLATSPSWAQSSPNRRLSPSSSRSSLSSMSGSPASQGLSDQALSQLRAYGNSFDQTRDMKRRLTLG